MNALPNDRKQYVMNSLVVRRKLDQLRSQLRQVHQRRAAGQLLLGAAVAAVVLLWLAPMAGWSWRGVISGFAAALVVAGLGAICWTRRLNWSDLELARMIEQRHPELQALMLTAVEQLDPKLQGGILAERLITQASTAGARTDWAASVTTPALRRANWSLGGAALACIVALVVGSSLLPRGQKEVTTAATATPAIEPAAPILKATVTPGDTEVERGSRLVVEAKFEKDVPAEATLVVTEPTGEERERIPMRLTVDQQVFGGLIARVEKDATYQVQFGAEQSAFYQIKTFVHPALERCDVTVTPPPYTGLPAREIKNTLKVSAMEGSELSFRIKINKPVKDAELFAEDKTILTLKPLPEDSKMLVGSMKADKTQKWRLHLVDGDERANKNPPWITVTVHSNQLAKIDVMFPKRDIQISAIQELPVEAKVWDDLGVTRSGATFSIAGKTKDVLFEDVVSEPAKKVDVRTLLAMEHEQAEPRQLVSYYFWAEDQGPTGEVRRSMSDMFFADIRHFEDIFREAEAPPGEPGQQQKGQSDKLVELQKQVMNATWRLIRDTQGGRTMEAAAPDVSVVHQSQEIALTQTKEAMEEVEDAEVKTALTEAWKQMKDALDPLAQAAEEKKKGPLTQALAFEQSALEWLHRAQSREHRVMRQKQQSQGGAAQQANQNQLMNLELKQQEQRYEEERKASEEQSAEQQENLQVLNRLKELARRQEALAEKVKELENQIAQAKTQEEADDLKNQLKRLQEEQEQLLRDLDDLKERMEKPENASNMAEAQEQLEQTREKVAEAAERLREQKLTEATAAATRAQRELEKMQEDFRQKTAKRFSDEMRQLRHEAREATQRQQQISEALENQKTQPETGDTSGSLEKMLDGSKVARQIDEQQAKLQELMENMRRISEQAEGNNPLLHRHLYEAVRDAQVGGLEQNLQEARDQIRYGNRSDSQEAERKASASVEQLQKGVEKAAETVLGSETEALRMARAEIDKLLDDVRNQQAENSDANQSRTEPGQPADARPSEQANAAGQAPRKGPSKDPSAVAENKSANGAPNTPDAERKGASKGEGTSEQQPQQAGAEPGGEQGPASPQQKGQPSPQQAQAGASGEPGDKPAGERAGAQPTQAQAQTPSPKGGEGQSKAPGEPSPSQGPGQSPSGQLGPQQQQDMSPGQQTAGTDSQQGEPNNSSGQTSPSGTRPAGGSVAAGGGSSGGGSNRFGGDDRRTSLLPGANSNQGGGFFFEESSEAENRDPLTGNGYEQWTDRLRNVEELLNQPELRNEAAKLLDNARAIRIDHERNNITPQADHLEARITKPLVELRDRVAEELAKRDKGNPLTPVDRDPVPPAFRDLVRRYYTELGAGK